MDVRPIRLALVTALASLTLAACGGDTPGTLPTTGDPTNFSPPAGGDGGAGTVTFTTGTAHVETSDGASADIPVDPDGSSFNDTDDTGSLSFSADNGDAVAMGGKFSDGPTNVEPGTSLSLTIALGGAFYSSIAGECTLDFDDVGADAVTGSFECSDLNGGTGPVDINGDFEARP